MKSVKKLYFNPDFFFLQIKCYFFITPTEFECLHFEISKSVYSKPLAITFYDMIILKEVPEKKETEISLAPKSGHFDIVCIILKNH